MPEGHSYTWKTKMLGTICELSGGYGFPDSFQGSINGELPFIKVSDMSLSGNEREIVNANNYVSMRIADSMRWKPFPAGAVVFAKVGAALKLNRRRVLIKPTLIDNNMMAAIPQGGFESAFLYHFLCAIDFGNFVQDGALPSVNQEQIGSIKIPDISKDEQHRIAEILDTIDEAIQKIETLISKLKAMKQGLLHDLLTRGLDEKGKLRDPKAHPEQFKDSSLGKIPMEWEVEKLGEVCRRSGGSVQTGPFGSQLHAKDYKDSGIPIITVEHLGDNEIIHNNLPLVGKMDYERLGRYLLVTGDLVFSRVGAIDRCAYVSEQENGWLFSGRCLRVRTGGKLVNPSFLSFQLNSYASRKWILNHAVGSTMACLNTAILSEVPVSLPPIQEQRAIALLLDAHDACIRTEEGYRDKLKLQKKGLMHDLLTGKVRVQGITEWT